MSEDPVIDPVIGVLTYVHAYTRSLHTQSLCDAAWDHYKMVVTERDRLRTELEWYMYRVCELSASVRMDIREITMRELIDDKGKRARAALEGKPWTT